jgi:hypothetical protein
VPDTDRGLEENRFTSIEELAASVQAHPNDDSCLSTEQHHHLPYEPAASVPSLDPTDRDSGDTVYEMLSSGIFPLDRPAAFAEADKLSFLADAIPISQSRDGDNAEPYAM